MPNIKRLISFFISIFVTLLFVSLIAYIITPFVQKLSPYVVNEAMLPLLYTLALFFYALIQALIKYYSGNKILAVNSVLLSVNTEAFKIREKLWFHAFIFLFYFAPFLRSLSLSSITILRIILFVISLLLSNVLLNFSSRTMKIYLLRNSILITGLDFRLDLPFFNNLGVHNNSGYYYYEEIEGYLVFPDHIELYLIHERGTITLKDDNELNRQIVGVLSQHKIEMRKYV